MTLLPRTIAIKGYKFYFRYSNDCKLCRYSKICIGGLKENHLYEVTDILKANKEIICPITNEKVIPVIVKYAIIKANLMSRGSLSISMKLIFNPPPCDKFNCPSRKFCYPKGLKKGDVVEVKKIYSRSICPLGYHLILADVIPHPP